MLVDISLALLDLARQRIAEAPAVVQQRVADLREDSITDLTHFPDQCFDAVLCLGGPLSHVVEEMARRRAVAELRRVAKPVRCSASR
jgi:ubiquinone/menaquinone biosynthesis C-methylase UbiE